ncbi:HSCB oligomerization domain protein, partial [Necator americanus]
MDSAFLMEMMEWNERVSEMSSKDDLTTEKTTVQEEIDGIMEELGKQFADKNLDG